MPTFLAVFELARSRVSWPTVKPQKTPLVMLCSESPAAVSIGVAEILKPTHYLRPSGGAFPLSSTGWVPLHQLADTAKEQRTPRATKQPFAAQARTNVMPNDIQALASLLVEVLYISTDGRPMQWRMPAELNEVTAKAIAFAVERGWLLIGIDNSVCLTEAGRDLIEGEANDRLSQD